MPSLLTSKRGMSITVLGMLILMTPSSTMMGSAFFLTPPPTTSQVSSSMTTRLLAATEAADRTLPSAKFPLEFVKTTRSNETLHNFGAASSLDAVLHTAERPGNPPTKDGAATLEQVREWIDYIKNGQGVTNVIALLEESELAIYDEAVAAESTSLEALMQASGITWQRISMKDKDASDRIMGLIRSAEDKGEKIVTHCTGGIGRCGRVCAAWLVHRYELSPEVATLVVLDHAHKKGVQRLGHSEKLREWMTLSP